MLATAVSKRDNKCVQIYATNFGWARVHLMASYSEANELLPQLLARDGVPSACLSDNSKEIIQGKFYQKLKDVACQLKQMEVKFCRKRD